MNDLTKYFHEQRMKLLDFAYTDSSGESVESIKEQLFGFYSSFNLIVANLGAASVYRVRKIDAGVPHQKSSDVWHPPANRITSIGRANDVGEAVFYCSLDAATAIAEAQIAVGDRFSLAIYRLAGREPYNMSSVVVREAQPLSGHGEEFSRFGTELSRFMVNEFTRPVVAGNEHHYKRSCAISKILFDLPHKDSIIYPSVRDGDSVNVAIHSNFAYERLTLLQVATCTMERDGNITVSALRRPDSDESLISESTPHPMPVPLNLSGSRISFSESFRDDKIATQEEILKYHMANKTLQWTPLRGATKL